MAADGGDDEVAIAGKTAASTMQADAFLQSAYNVSEDEQMRSDLSDLKNTVEANPLSFHTRKIQAFGVCAASSPDLMNILTSANIVMPKGKPDSLPEFLLPVVRAVMRIQGKVLAAMEALLRDLLYYDALVKPMAKCLITLDMSAIDMKAVMGREGVARLGLDKTKLDVKAAPSTLAFHAVWPVLTFVFGLVNQWDEDASMTMVRLGSRVTEAMMAGHAFVDALAPIGFHFQMFALMAEDLHKGGEAFPCLTDVYESEAKGEFMTPHRSRSVVAAGGIDLNSKAFKDAVAAVVKGQKVGAPRPTPESGDTDEAAAVKKAANVAWATRFLKETTLPVPAATDRFQQAHRGLALRTAQDVLAVGVARRVREQGLPSCAPSRGGGARGVMSMCPGGSGSQPASVRWLGISAPGTDGSRANAVWHETANDGTHVLEMSVPCPDECSRSVVSWCCECVECVRCSLPETCDVPGALPADVGADMRRTCPSAVGGFGSLVSERFQKHVNPSSGDVCATLPVSDNLQYVVELSDGVFQTDQINTSSGGFSDNQPLPISSDFGVDQLLPVWSLSSDFESLDLSRKRLRAVLRDQSLLERFGVWLARPA